MTIILPDVLSLSDHISRNPIQQLAVPSTRLEGNLATFRREQVRGFLFQSNDHDNDVLVIQSRRHLDTLPADHTHVLLAQIDPAAETADLTTGVWLRHPFLPRAGFDHDAETQAVLESWNGAFSFVEENPTVNVPGLRKPQIGALHAVHAHWSVTDETATIVMPTGTGKTETMLSLLVSARCPKLLVVVPTDTLRSQIADKFLRLGLLKHPTVGALEPQAKYPIICTLRHFPRTVEEANDIFRLAHVIVTTSNIAGQCDYEIKRSMAEHCPYLFIDEAHHAEAPTWAAFKKVFAKRRIVQFTATPFREDGRLLDGQIVYRYPLKTAQQEGYFRPITFVPVVEFNVGRADEAIAAAAIQQLRADIDRGHIVMARVDSVARAEQVFQIYDRYPELRTVQLHTGIKSLAQRRAIRQQIIAGESQIVVCVDMLGEGFDLPALKIAAFHDIRKTLAVTLQLAGRFTRARRDLGNATFIANTADVHVQDELRKLYTQDPDWNALLPQLNDSMVGEQLSLQEFLRGFAAGGIADEIPIKTIRAATSTVVYRTNLDVWMPENYRSGIPSIHSCAQVDHTLNPAQHTLVIVTARRVSLSWTDVPQLFSLDWELYVVFWDSEQNLLFINSSTNAGEYRALAEAVCGAAVEPVRGQDVFKTFAGVTRLKLQSVGLSEQIGRNVRYTARMGADVESGVTEVQRRRAVKSVLSGSGYENGERTTVGASRSGRIWSQRRGRIDQLTEWCRAVGRKILDPSINPDQVLQGTLETRAVAERPATMPIAVDWPEEIYTEVEATWTISIGDQSYALSELSINIVNPALNGPLRFEIAADADRVLLELELFEQHDRPTYRFRLLGDRPAYICRGRRAIPRPIDVFFYENPVSIWFADGSSLSGSEYVPLRHLQPPYDRNRIVVWDWADVDIRKESQGDGREADSIQAKVIRTLRQNGYDLIVDDDGSGEAADVVAIRIIGDRNAPASIDVEFYHCKYSHGNAPGYRILDLYEVCGQAQKSTLWMASHEKRIDLFTHLMRRDAHRVDMGRPSRYEVGNRELLQTIREMSRLCPISLRISIVQPGLSREVASAEQLGLLSVTETYLSETYQLPFQVIASQ